jgi:5-methylcytosine-specific restriction protein B
MPEEARLELEKTFGAIRKGALERRYISYRDVADASGVPWNTAWRLIPQHLDELLRLAHDRGWPMITAIVVRKDDVSTGTLRGEALSGFIAAAKKVGVMPGDPDQFVRDQQLDTFAWANNAPDRLDAPSSPTARRGLHSGCRIANFRRNQLGYPLISSGIFSVSFLETLGVALKVF